MIPTLLIDSNGGLVKTIKFRNRTYIGDPINAVKIFNDKGVDELVLLDIDASKEGRAPDYAKIEAIVSEAFMPISFGGGISSTDQMARLFQCGLEKVVLSTHAVGNIHLIREASARFGNQSIVVCLDVKKTWLGQHRVTTHAGARLLKLDPVQVALQMEDAGAGEIIVYSIDRDGSFQGMDLELIRMVATKVNVPVVACGGARNIQDFVLAVTQGMASAVAAGSMFVYQQPSRGVLISYPNEKELLQMYRSMNN